MGVMKAKVVGIAGTLVCASILVACSSTAEPAGENPRSVASVADGSLLCNGQNSETVGHLPGKSSSTVELVGVLKRSSDGNAGSFPVFDENATCLTSFTVTGNRVAFRVDPNIAATQLVYLEQQIWATGKFSSVSQATP
jgi:streptogramin lyase